MNPALLQCHCSDFSPSLVVSELHIHSPNCQTEIFLKVSLSNVGLIAARHT